VYVLGSTTSTDFPTTAGALQRTPANGYLAKLNPTGTALVYATYWGDTTSNGRSVAVDNAGNAYVAGYASNPNFTTTPGAFQTGTKVVSGGSTAVVQKLNATGAALVYSTFLGGTQPSYAVAIAVDSSGNAYVTGDTFASDFPVTAGAFQKSQAGGFVTKLNPAGSALVYSRC